MIRKNISRIACAAVLLCTAVPYAAYAEDTASHIVTVLDYNGNIMTELTVPDGQAAPLDTIDISSLNYYDGIYTQVGFNCWDKDTSNVTSDTTIKALYKKMTISLQKLPDKTEYYSPAGYVDLDGLSVYITIYTQTPVSSKNDGSYIVTREEVDIASKCTAVPSYLPDIFNGSDSAEISIYPISSDKPIASYKINYYPELGDADGDGHISSLDASYILKAYSQASIGSPLVTTETQLKRCDVDLNGSITANDASMVLKYYAFASTVDVPNWDEFIKEAKSK